MDRATPHARGGRALALRRRRARRSAREPGEQLPVSAWEEPTLKALSPPATGSVPSRSTCSPRGLPACFAGGERISQHDFSLISVGPNASNWRARRLARSPRSLPMRSSRAVDSMPRTRAASRSSSNLSFLTEPSSAPVTQGLVRDEIAALAVLEPRPVERLNASGTLRARGWWPRLPAEEPRRSSGSVVTRRSRRSPQPANERILLTLRPRRGALTCAVPGSPNGVRTRVST